MPPSNRDAQQKMIGVAYVCGMIATVEFMQQATIESRIGMESGQGGPFGCVIVKNGSVIAAAHNEVLLSNDPTAHAEMVAIRQACQHLGTYQLTGCELYTSCEPCPMCLGAIYWARPDKVYFANTKADAAAIGFDDQFIYQELDKPFEDRKIPMRHLPDETAKAVFADWAKMEERKMY
jgi:guanine deaminase